LQNGERVKLQEQPFQILLRLLETPGELVSREKLWAQLWPEKAPEESDRSLRELLVPAVRQALTEADSVFVAVSDRTARLLRSELGADADAVDWGDTAAFYQRLGFAYEAFRRFLTGARDAGRRVHVFAEPSVGGPDDDPSPEDRTGAYLAYEAFCNEAYAGCGCPVTCLWDTRRHSARLIENVRALHNHELGPGGDRYPAGPHRAQRPEVEVG